MALMMCCWPPNLDSMTLKERKKALRKWKCKHYLLKTDKRFIINRGK